MGNLKEEEMKAELSKEALAIIEYKDYIINNQREELAAAQRDMAVSYTHLDVYKRQGI